MPLARPLSTHAIRRALLGAAGALLVRAPAARAQQPSPSRVEVEAAMQHWIAMTKLVNADSAASVYTADAIMLQAGAEPITGREAIRAFLKPFDGRAVVDSISGHATQVDRYGDEAYLWGEYFQRTRIPPGEAMPYHGRFVIKWRRERDGVWRIARILMQPG